MAVPVYDLLKLADWYHFSMPVFLMPSKNHVNVNISKSLFKGW